MEWKMYEKRMRLFLVAVICLVGMLCCMEESFVSQAATGDVICTKTATMTWSKYSTWYSDDASVYSFTFEAPRDMWVRIELKSDKEMSQEPLINQKDANGKSDTISSGYSYHDNDDKKTYVDDFSVKKGTHTITIDWEPDDYRHIDSYSMQILLKDVTRYVESFTISKKQKERPSGGYYPEDSPKFEYTVNYSSPCYENPPSWVGNDHDRYCKSDLELVTMQASGASATLYTSGTYGTENGWIEIKFDDIIKGGSCTVKIRDKITGVESEPFTYAFQKKSPFPDIEGLEQKYAYDNKNEMNVRFPNRGITSIKIYRSEQEDGVYRCIATLKPKKAALDEYILYKDKSVKANKKYCYKLSILVNGYEQYSELQQKPTVYWTAPKRVKGKAKVKKGWIKWKKVKGAGVRYALIIAKSSGGISKQKIAKIGNLAIYKYTSSSSYTAYYRTSKCKIRDRYIYSRKVYSYVKHNGDYYSHGKLVSSITFGEKKVTK